VRCAGRSRRSGRPQAVDARLTIGARRRTDKSLPMCVVMTCRRDCARIRRPVWAGALLAGWKNAETCRAAPGKD
jgi:hypothetical protein